MNKKKKYFYSIGTMSGTSFDGVDAALIKTDGYDFAHRLCNTFLEYTKEEKKLYHFSLFENLKKIKEIIDKKHFLCITKLLRESKFDINKVDVIGVHGQTFDHNPAEHWTWQYINTNKIVKSFNTKVVSDLRLKDLNYGGEGAPLVPIFHKLLCKGTKQDFPIVVLNIGGITNATVINNNKIIKGFDVGPGNGPLDTLVFKKLNINMDYNGKLASKGRPNESIANKIFYKIHNHFKSNSLDRNKVDNICIEPLNNMNINNSLATVTLVICKMIYFRINPFNPSTIILVGGGRKNKFLVKKLKNTLNCSVKLSEEVGWNGDTLEAEAFAYLAVRSLLGLNITYKETTGVISPIPGGILHNTLN